MDIDRNHGGKRTLTEPNQSRCKANSIILCAGGCSEHVKIITFFSRLYFDVDVT